MKPMNIHNQRHHQSRSRQAFARPSSPKKMHGMTLIEVMVVVVILAILAGVVAPKVFGNREQAQITKVKQDIRAIEAALSMYRMHNFQYPSTEQGLEALVKQPSTDPVPKNWQAGGYLPRVPKDPWGENYHYLSPGSHGEFDLYSNGVPNSGDNKKIGNWNLAD